MGTAVLRIDKYNCWVKQS